MSLGKTYKERYARNLIRQYFPNYQRASELIDEYQITLNEEDLDIFIRSIGASSFKNAVWFILKHHTEEMIKEVIKKLHVIIDLPFYNDPKIADWRRSLLSNRDLITELVDFIYKNYKNLLNIEFLLEKMYIPNFLFYCSIPELQKEIISRNPSLITEFYKIHPLTKEKYGAYEDLGNIGL